MDQKRSTGRLARWAMEIQGYQFEIIHKPGKSNQVAVALSKRQYVAETNDATVASFQPNHSVDDDKEIDFAVPISEPVSDEPNSEPTQVTLFYCNDDPNEGTRNGN